MEPAPCRQLRNEPSGDRPGGLFYAVCAASKAALAMIGVTNSVPRTVRAMDTRASDVLSPLLSKGASFLIREIGFRATLTIQHWRHDQGARNYAALVCIPK